MRPAFLRLCVFVCLCVCVFLRFCVSVLAAMTALVGENTGAWCMSTMYDTDA